MYDFKSRLIIEALRSGISSRDVGHCFSSARPKLMRGIQSALDDVAGSGKSGGMIISGKYGEGKTHLLNTVFDMARQQNMVVSMVSLSKETPFSALHQAYPKILQNTYLPGEVQPGLPQAFERMESDKELIAALYEYSLTSLGVNKLYYVLKSYLGTQDEEEKYLLRGDIEGDFMTGAAIKKIYKRIYGETAVFDVNFVKSRHTSEYLAFLSRVFVELGYNGWVLLFDEAELIGRMGKKARLTAYLNIHKLLKPERMEAVYCVFAFNASYLPDVIEAKNEHANLKESALCDADKRKIAETLSRISSAPQLAPLAHEEIIEVLEKIQEYHGRAYGWSPDLDVERVLSLAQKHGHLLRTHIRTAVELLDQILQYGDAGEIRINELTRELFEESGEQMNIFDG